MANGKFTASQRAACFERAGGACEVCGYRLREGWNLHHRKALGMGGTKRAVTCADGLAVCGLGNTSGCHQAMDTEREWALGRGYVILRNSPLDPLDVPVFTVREGWVYFDADGSTRPARLAEEVPF